MIPDSQYGYSDEISPETRERYRRMTNEERFKLTLEMTAKHLQSMLAGPPEAMARFFETVRREHDEQNRLIREHLGRLTTRPYDDT